jgi:ketosteroid isomerase-like protein
MRNRVLMAPLLNVVAILAFSMPVFADGRATPSMAELTEQVRATEIAFAKTLADRDVKAFTSMIAPDVIWIADKPLHGPSEVVVSWQQFFEGPKAPFSWAPEIVEVQEGGKLALSRGPVMNPEGQRVGTYTSIWRREKSGKWLIIFDSGCPGCDCAAEKK